MFKRFAIAALAVVMAGGVSAGPAKAASLVGANVGCSFVDAAPLGIGRTCTGGFVVTAMGAMPDTQIALGGGSIGIIDINFMNRWVDITGSFDAVSVFSPGSSLTLSGIFSQTGAPLQGFGALSITDIDGLTPDGITFDGALGTLTIDFGGTTWTGSSAIGLDLTAPLPAPILLLLSGLLGLGAMRRLRA